MEFNKNEINILSTLAEQEDIINSLFSKIESEVKDDLYNWKINMEEAWAYKNIIKKLRKKIISYK